MIEHDEQIGEPFGDFEDLRRVENRRARGGRGACVLFHHRETLRIETRREGLVEQPEFRLHREQGGKRRLVELTATEVGQRSLGQGEQVEIAQHGENALVEPGGVAFVNPQQKRDVLKRAEVAVERGEIRKEKQTAPQIEPRAIETRAVHQQLAPRGSDNAAEAAQQRRLAGTVESDDRDNRAGRDGERNIVEGTSVAVGFGEVPEFDLHAAEGSGRGRGLANGFSRTQPVDGVRVKSQVPCPMSAPTPPEFSLSDIGQIAITVSDVAKATGFYRDVLGLKFLFPAGPNLAFLAAGSVRIMLTTPQGHGEVGKNSTLYFKVAGEITAAHAAIIARGAVNERAPQLTAKMPDHELWMAFVRDPDGNLVGLMEERRGIVGA